MKKVVSFVLLFILLGSFVLNVGAETELHWYIKRNGKNCPSFPKEASEIDKYDCYYVDTSGEKRMFLTFDAGYENGNVEKILDVLKEKEVPAAFFLLDNIILKNTDLVLRMANEGHLVCNHTKNHKNLSSSAEDEITRNLRSLEMIYEENAVGKWQNTLDFLKENIVYQPLLRCKSLGIRLFSGALPMTTGTTAVSLIHKRQRKRYSIILITARLCYSILPHPQMRRLYLI